MDKGNINKLPPYPTVVLEDCKHMLTPDKDNTMKSLDAKVTRSMSKSEKLDTQTDKSVPNSTPSNTVSNVCSASKEPGLDIPSNSSATNKGVATKRRGITPVQVTHFYDYNSTKPPPVITSMTAYNATTGQLLKKSRLTNTGHVVLQPNVNSSTSTESVSVSKTDSKSNIVLLTPASTSNVSSRTLTPVSTSKVSSTALNPASAQRSNKMSLSSVLPQPTAVCDAMKQYSSTMRKGYPGVSVPVKNPYDALDVSDQLDVPYSLKAARDGIHLRLNWCYGIGPCINGFVITESKDGIEWSVCKTVGRNIRGTCLAYFVNKEKENWYIGIASYMEFTSTSGEKSVLNAPKGLTYDKILSNRGSAKFSNQVMFSLTSLHHPDKTLKQILSELSTTKMFFSQSFMTYSVYDQNAWRDKVKDVDKVKMMVVHNAPFGVHNPCQFYNVLYSPINATPLPNNGAKSAKCTQNFMYKFSIDQTMSIIMLAAREKEIDSKRYRIFLRICEMTDGVPQKEAIPDCIIWVNSQMVLVQVNNKPKGSLDITDKCLFNRYKSSLNRISMEWMPVIDKEYCLTISVVEILEPEEIVLNIMKKNVKPAAETKEMVKDLLKSDTVSDISYQSLKTQLTCPLGKSRIVTPCRGSRCTHFYCMDAFTLLKLNESRPHSQKKCFMCDEPLESLYVDGLFLKILRCIPENVDEVLFGSDGNWWFIQNGKLVTESTICVDSVSSPPPESDVNDTGSQESEGVLNEQLKKVKLQLETLASYSTTPFVADDISAEVNEDVCIDITNDDTDYMDLSDQIMDVDDKTGILEDTVLPDVVPNSNAHSSLGCFVNKGSMRTLSVSPGQKYDYLQYVQKDGRVELLTKKTTKVYYNSKWVTEPAPIPTSSEEQPVTVMFTKQKSNQNIVNYSEQQRMQKVEHEITRLLQKSKSKDIDLNLVESVQQTNKDLLTSKKDKNHKDECPKRSPTKESVNTNINRKRKTVTEEDEKGKKKKASDVTKTDATKNVDISKKDKNKGNIEFCDSPVRRSARVRLKNLASETENDPDSIVSEGVCEPQNDAENRACSDINRGTGNTNKKAEVNTNAKTQGKDETNVNLNAVSATEVTQKQRTEILTEGMEGCTNIETRATENNSIDKAINNKEFKSSSNKEENEVDIIEIESSDDEFVVSEVSKTYASLTRKKNGETEQRNIRRSSRVKSIRNTEDDQNTTVSSAGSSKVGMTTCSKLSERDSTNTQNEAVKEGNQVDAQSAVEDHNNSDVNQTVACLIQEEKTETEEPSIRKSSRIENKKDSQEEKMETVEPSIRKSSRIEKKKDSQEEKMETVEPSIRRSSRLENKKDRENDTITSVSSDTFSKEPESVCSKLNERSSASTPKKAVKERNEIDAQNAVKDHNYSDIKQIASNVIQKEIIKDHNYSDVKQVASKMIQKDKTETEEPSIRKLSRIENQKDSHEEKLETDEPRIRKSSRIENKKDSPAEKLETEEPSIRKSSRIENKKDSQAEKMETEDPSKRKSSRIENKKDSPAEKMETEEPSIRKSSRIENKKDSQEETMETEESSIRRSAGIYINKKKDSENDNVTSVSLDTFSKELESMCSKTNSAHSTTVSDQLINVPSKPLSEECLQFSSNTTAAQNDTVESEIIQTKNAGKKSLERSKSLGSDTNEAHGNMTADKLSGTSTSSGELLGENGPVCSDVDADKAHAEDLTLNDDLNESDESDNDIEMEDDEEGVENIENLDSDSSSPSQTLVSDNQCVIPQKSNLLIPISYNYNKYKSKYSSEKKSKSLPSVEPLIIDCNESNEIHPNPVSKKYQGKKLTSSRSEVQNTTSEYVPFIVDCAVPDDVIDSDNILDEATESDNSLDEGTDCTSEINKSIDNLNAMEVSYDETGSEDETPLINLSDTSDAIPELTNESPGAETFSDIPISDTSEKDDGNSAEADKTSENTDNANVNDIITIDDDDDSKNTEMDSVSDIPQQDENNASKPSVSDAMETEKHADKSEKKQSPSSAKKTVHPSYIVVNTVTSSSGDNKGRYLDVYDRRNELMELEDLGNIKRKPRNNCRKFQLDKDTMIANNSVVGEYVPGHPYMGKKPTPGPSTKRQMKYLESGIMTKTTENKRVRDKNITQIYTRPGHELLSPKLKKLFRSHLPPLPSSIVKSPEPTSSRQSSVDSVISVNSDNPTDRGCTSGNQCETGSVNTETDKVNIIKTEHSEEEYVVSQVNKTYSGVVSKGNAITEQQNQTIPSRSEEGNTENEQQNMQRSSGMKSNTDTEVDQIDCKDNIPILSEHPDISHNDQVSDQPGTSNQLGDNGPVSGTFIKTEQVEAEQAVIPKNVSPRKSPSQAVNPDNVSARKSPSQAVIPKNVSARKSPRQLTAKNKEKFKNIIDAVRSSRITREVN